MESSQIVRMLSLHVVGRRFILTTKLLMMSMFQARFLLKAIKHILDKKFLQNLYIM